MKNKSIFGFIGDKIGLAELSSLDKVESKHIVAFKSNVRKHRDTLEKLCVIFEQGKKVE